jgi:hypothetical protein
MTIFLGVSLSLMMLTMCQGEILIYMEAMMGSLDKVAKHVKAKATRFPEFVLARIAVCVSYHGDVCCSQLSVCFLDLFSSLTGLIQPPFLLLCTNLQVLRGMNYLKKHIRVIHRGTL